MTADEQVKLWVNGKAVHNPDRDECCPDFSCCGQKMVSKEIRVKFQSANKGTRMEMLGMFLGNALRDAFPEKQIYVAGETENSHLRQN